MRAQADAVASEMLRGERRIEPGKKSLTETRQDVIRGWHAVARQFTAGGQRDLAYAVRRFVDGMSPVTTEREWMALDLRQRLLMMQTKVVLPQRVM